MIGRQDCALHDSIATLAAAVAATDARMPFVRADALVFLDELGFGPVSSAFGTERLDDEPDVDRACEALRSYGAEVKLPVLAALAEVAASSEGISDEAFALLEGITARLCSTPGSIRLA